MSREALPMLCAAFAVGVVALWLRGYARSSARLASASVLRSRELLATVCELSEASRHSSERVLEALARAVRRVDERVDGVLVFRPVGEDLECVHVTGTRAAHLGRVRLRRGEPRFLPVQAADSGSCAQLTCYENAIVPTDRFAVAVPMFDGRSLLAVTYAASSHVLDAGVRDSVVQTVGRAAAPYAIALERELDRTDAAHDALTDLLSARSFRRLLEAEVSRAAACDRRGFAVWYADADDFKRVNDRLGHAAGDRVLCAIAMLLEEHLFRHVDLAARNGGDEFCALLRATPKGRAIERAQAFCDAVRAHDFGVAEQITVSIGVAAYPHDGTTAGALLEVADAAMYRSKREGRDRVSFAALPGAFASLRAKAAWRLSRSPFRCRSNCVESSERCCY